VDGEGINCYREVLCVDLRKTFTPTVVSGTHKQTNIRITTNKSLKKKNHIKNHKSYFFFFFFPIVGNFISIFFCHTMTQIGKILNIKIVVKLEPSFSKPRDLEPSIAMQRSKGLKRGLLILRY
jgi:hypothetical protein